jgi:C4-dicarboxylate-specific signal transduction histidine kinase
MTAAITTASNRLAARIPLLTAQALRDADKRLSLLGLIIMAASCIVGALIALVLAGRIVRPVVRLAQGTRAIAQGDLGRRVDENAPDEIGDLAAAFNTMTASLARSKAELQGAEAQLVQSAKLASLGTLSAGVAHELNQPVAIIRGLCQQLKDEPCVSDEAKSDLAIIEGQTGRMMQIIKHLRTFCRAGNQEMADLDANDSVRNCFILIGAQLKAHNIDVALELYDHPALVRGNANELEQVFLNLISNARDAIEGRPGARITIRSLVAGDRFVIEFRDNGPGVPRQIAGHIFDPFFTTKEAGKGTGLGLSISHGIIEKHHGTISVWNDAGAVFTVKLPLAEAHAETRIESRPALKMAA